MTKPHIVAAAPASSADCLSISIAWMMELFPPELGPYMRVILDSGTRCSTSPNALKFLSLSPNSIVCGSPRRTVFFTKRTFQPNPALPCYAKATPCLAMPGLRETQLLALEGRYGSAPIHDQHYRLVPLESRLGSDDADHRFRQPDRRFRAKPITFEERRSIGVLGVGVEGGSWGVELTFVES